MTRNDKTPVAAGACDCKEPCLDCGCQITTKPRERQPPRLDSAFRESFHRYVVELRVYDELHGDRTTEQMINCAEYLLIESERLEVRP